MDKRIEITAKGAKAKQSHVIQERAAVLDARGSAKIKVVAGREELSGMEREGDDLILRFADGTIVRLDGYFACPAEDIAELLYADVASGAEWQVNFDNLACHAADAASEALHYSFASVSSASAAGLGSGLGIALAGLAGVGGIVAAASGGGGGGGKRPPSGPADTTAPDAPAVNPTNGKSLSGTAEPGSTVRIDVNGDGTVDATATTDGSGNWSFTPSAPLPDGVPVHVTAVDPAGNVSQPTTVTVDAAAPAVPAVAQVLDDAGAVTGPLTSGGATDDTTPTLSGTTEAGATVSIYDNGTLLGTVTADGSGNWSFTPPTPLAEGPHSFTVIATDAVGNQSAPSPAFDLTVDATAPTAPVLNPTDGTTVSGTAEPGTTVAVDTNGDGTPDATATTGDSGNWSVTLDPPLADGTTVTATATDPAGNVSPPATATVDTSIDTTPPPVPTIGQVLDDAGAITGALASGGATDDTTPALSGTAEANTTVSVYDNGTLLGTATADGAGAWSFTPPAPLAEGPHSFTVTATDTAGNQSAPSPAFDLTIDTTPPAAPVINPTDGVTITGTAEAGAMIGLDTNGDGTPDATTTTDASGNWSITLDPPLADGTAVTATATDPVGNTGPAASVTVDGSLDTTPPLVPAIGQVLDDAGAVTGPLTSGGATDDTTPALSGTAEAGTTVSVYDSGTLLGTVTADGTGAWSFAPAAPLAEGLHSFTVTATDAVGNESAPSPAFDLTVDTIAPTATVAITGITDDTGAQGDWSTEDSSPTILGTLGAPLESGDVVQVSLDGGTTWTDATVNGTDWFFGAGTLSPGSYTVDVRVTDAAGNMGNSASQAITIEADVNQAPLVMVDETDLLGLVSAEVLGLLDLNDTSLAAIDPDGNLQSVVVNYSPLLSLNLGAFTFAASEELAAQLGLQIVIENDPGILGIIAPSSTLTITALDGGTIDNVAINLLLRTVHFEQDVTLIGLDVLSSTTITATDSEGLTATAGVGNLLDLSLLNVNGDPTVIEGAASDDTLTGTAANELLFGYDGNDVLSGGDGNDVLNGGAGADTLDGGAGDDVLFFDPTDTSIDGGDGNDVVIVDSDTPVTVDGTTNLRNIERIDLGTGDTGRSLTLTAEGVVQATAGSGQLVITGDSGDSVVLSGATLQGQVLIDGKAYDQYALGTATVLVQGGVTVDVPVDMTPPPAPVINPTDGVTFTGTAEAGATIGLDTNGDGTPDATATADGSGNWSVTLGTPLANGTLVSVIATDVAGNISPPATVTVDTSVDPIPIPPLIGEVSDDAGAVVGAIVAGGTTDDTTPTVAGSGAEANATVSVYGNGALLGTVTADASGNWSFTPVAALAAGAYSITATVTDAGGNESLPSAAFAFTIDAGGPTATVTVTGISDDTGAQGDWSTTDTSPTIVGTLSAALESGEAVQVSLDGGATWTNATLDGTNWFFGPGVLGTGSHTVDVRLVGAGGSIGSTISQAITIEASVNQAPFAQATSASLLGLVSAETLGIIDFNEQALTAFDVDGNLDEVVVGFSSLVNLDINAYGFTYSADLAAELGLTVTVENDPGILGLLFPSSTVTITASDGGPIDNLEINELLKTVHFQDDVTLLGVSLADTTTIAATDGDGLSASSVTGSLLNASLLNVNGDPTVIEGTAGDDALTGTAANERLYGYGGNDTLSGGDGNDLLRGGAGADTLDGGLGNDLLVYDAADTLINGGDGFDVLLVRDAVASLDINATANLQNIERIDLGSGDTGRGLTLSEDGVVQATDSNNQLIVTGDSNDSVTMTGATLQGQVLVDGHAYNQYALGSATVLVEDPVLVAA